MNAPRRHTAPPVAISRGRLGVPARIINDVEKAVTKKGENQYRRRERISVPARWKRIKIVGEAG